MMKLKSLVLLAVMGSAMQPLACENRYQTLYGPADIVPALKAYPDWVAQQSSDSLPSVANDVVVIVTSDNPIKVAAAQALFKENPRFIHSTLTFVPVKTNSGIAEQPLGIAYGRMGALNRIEDARKNPITAPYMDHAPFFCAIENFFTTPQEGAARDHAYIIIASSHHSTYERVSDGIKIADDIYQKALQEGVMSLTGCSVTIGEYLHKEFGFNSKDWVKDVTQTPDRIGLTRQQQIVTTLQNGPWF